MAIFAEVSDNELIVGRHPRRKWQFYQYCAISGKRCEIGRNKLVLFTNIGSGIRASSGIKIDSDATLPID